MKQFLAYDIGGTSAKYALVSADGHLQPLGRFPTGSSMTRHQLEEAMLETLRSCPIPHPDGIGVSTLGAVDRRAGHVLGAVENMPCVEGFCPEGIFHQLLPDTPVSIMNDASAAALGEQWLGAARGHDNFLCVVFGTGVGSCIVINGQPLEGAHHLAGEIGYWNYTAPDNYWELSVSAQALFAEARRQTGDSSLDGVRFFDLLSRNDPICGQLFENWTRQIGRVFSNLILMLDVDRIVVGGGISAQGERLTQPLLQATNAFLPADFRDGCSIVPAVLGNQAALLGAIRPLL